MTGLRPGTTMYRIDELERAMRQLDQHVRELRAIQLTLLSRVAVLENAAGIPEDDIAAWQREAWEEPGPDERSGFGPRPPRDGGGAGRQGRGEPLLGVPAEAHRLPYRYTRGQDPRGHHDDAGQDATNAMLDAAIDGGTDPTLSCGAVEHAAYQDANDERLAHLNQHILGGL